MQPLPYSAVVSGASPKSTYIETPSTLTTPLADNIPSKVLQGWPKWPVFHTVHLEDHLKSTDASLDPVAINNRTRYISRSASPAKVKLFWGKLESSLIFVIRGSNFVESVGCGLCATENICREVFRGNAQKIKLDIDETDIFYKEHINYLLETHREPTKQNIIQSRKEAIQHASALAYMIDRVVLNGETLTEKTICDTHRILQDDNSASSQRYRDHEVAVAYTKPGEDKLKVSHCIREKAVPTYMRDMIYNLKTEIEACIQKRTMDPYTLAARYAHQFVMIHPFSDGNGRMSRIILNTLLLKYAGHVSIIGLGEMEKWEYIDAVSQAGKKFRDEDMEVSFGEQTSHREFAKFVLRRAKGSLEMMRGWAADKSEVGEEPGLEGMLVLT